MGFTDPLLEPLALPARYMVPHERIELPSEDYKAPVLPLY